MDINEIKKILPHRYPFLLVDKVLGYEEGIKIAGQKNVTINEPFFQGHFPEEPIMPGVLMAEALAQLGAILVLKRPENKGKLVFYAGIDKMRFKRPVVPGDVLNLEVEVIKIKGSIGKAKGIAKVGKEVACQGEIMFALQDKC